MELDFDRWEGNRNKSNSTTIKVDDVEMVLKRLQALDQKTHTQLVIGSSASNLSIGGGNGQYVCTLTLGYHEQYYNLVNNSRQGDENERDVVTGGQAGSFPQRIVVDYETASSAITYYIANQAMNPDLKWEED